MKLYIWENVLKDWTYGIMFAYANSLKQAKEKIIQKLYQKEGKDNAKLLYLKRFKKELNKKKYRIINKTEGFYILGGQ